MPELTKLSRGVFYAIYFLVVLGLALVITLSFHSTSKPKPAPAKPIHPSAAPSKSPIAAAPKPPVAPKLNQAKNNQTKSTASTPAPSSTSSPTTQLSNTGPGDSAVIAFGLSLPAGYYLHRRWSLRKLS